MTNIPKIYMQIAFQETTLYLKVKKIVVLKALQPMTANILQSWAVC